MKKNNIIFLFAFLIISCNFFKGEKKLLNNTNDKIEMQYQLPINQPYKSFADFVKELPTLQLPIKTDTFISKTHYNYIGYFSYDSSLEKLLFDTYSIIGKYIVENTYFIVYKYKIEDRNTKNIWQKISICSYNSSGELIDKLDIAENQEIEQKNYISNAEIDKKRIIKSVEERLNIDKKYKKEFLIKKYIEEYSFDKNYFVLESKKYKCEDVNFNLLNELQSYKGNTNLLKLVLDFYTENYLQCKTPNQSEIQDILFFLKNENVPQTISFTQLYTYFLTHFPMNKQIILDASNSFWDNELFVTAYHNYISYVNIYKKDKNKIPIYITERITIPYYIKSVISNRKDKQLLTYFPMQKQDKMLYLLVFSSKNIDKNSKNNFYDIVIYVEEPSGFKKFENNNLIPTSFTFYTERDWYNSNEKYGDLYIQSTKNSKKYYGLDFEYDEINKSVTLWVVKEFLVSNTQSRIIDRKYYKIPFDSAKEIFMIE
ncbi:hypothetical protein [Capnocytophaga catalasegens]|uniref:Lipoprotein n=1 Tax=Capnocytophaga catalasegens TaxID=1004260 RepID=A0AAV5AWE8_9FLAO|nr:hypothetical protein [Capnocytophaga catalasegens]GIZ15371.1 hypothetical protein RCZ03_13710 [Capnocytophaga catalasegens]GJM50959.1 hypothetical protein RCZ15_19320 [Capnocytophaga catalasegens]GJM52143.1 hypothetical protein RCZ16_04610 [Capnocytophaga catalasegens]